MKRRNINKTIMQRGGLMIEALAMLGLIAVVTPTMYKKSAERTMEVEDINTASTIRTVMNAANDYVSSNYSWLISQMNADGQIVRDITAADIRPFLPYGFNLNQPLHNYNAPILKVKRPSTDSNNLTAFALFPARATPEEGIGQERTSRIAALIGSNGGYKSTEDAARGVGGIWSLDATAFREVFGGNQGNQYSIVTASTDIINSATNNEVDMSKYLQRGSDNVAGTEWKNTMRTDLYMGGPNQDGDIYENLTGPYSIRNIKSLIVGANNGEETGNYGLYIAPDAANPNAYVHGSLEAGENHFKVDNANLQFGADGAWNFVVNTVGKVMNKGDLELASDNAVWNDIKIGALRNNGSNKYLIQGSKSAATLPEGSGGGMLPPYDYGSLTFMDDLMKLTDATDAKDKKVKIMENGWAKDEDGNAFGDIKYIRSITSIDPSHPTAVSVPEFPVEIDANTKVKGLLAAGQIDTNKIRSASLSVGSEHINDKYQWMTVDEKGVLIADPDRTSNTKTKNRININKDQIVLSVDKEEKEVKNPRGKDAADGHETSEHDAQIVMNAKNTLGVGDDAVTKDASIEIKAPNTSIHGNSTTVSGKGTLVQAGSSTDYGVTGNELNDNILLMRNDNMQIRLADREMIIGPRSQSVNGIDYVTDDEYKVRTTFHRGNLDLIDSNLNIRDANQNPVFSVGTNGKLDGFTTPYTDIYTVAKGEELGGITITDDNRKETTGSKSKYDVAAHGNIIFTDKLVPEKAGNRSDLHRTYLSMGDAINSFAAVNIVGLSVDSSDGENEFAKVPSSNKSNIVFVDQVASSKYNNKNLAESGTIYIRKGYMEVKGNDSFTTRSNNDAKSGNGVLAASRFVANNPDKGGHTTGSINGQYGATVPDLVSDYNKSLYSITSQNRYDTYMVNPAYTSVMHDIKLTTRGGARLSDVLPDFINKGIYVVTNTFNEVPNDPLTYFRWPTINDKGRISFGTRKYYPIQKLNRGQTWASPFLGVVPAPQCPPGYGRVITLNPASFEMGIAGQLKQVSDGRYYVSPTTLNSSDDLKASVNKEAEFVQATVQGTGSASMSIEGRLGSAGQVNGSVDVSNLKGIKTSEYVLSSNNSKLKPLVIQQSTYLKSQIKPLKTVEYTRGWATIMGFLYYDKNYQAFRDSSTASDKSGYSWNIFPVMPGTLEGYATVYCYFNRTNMNLVDINKPEAVDFKEGYNTFIDNNDYMVNLGSKKPPAHYHKEFSSSGYRERLNDPELKYDEVW